MTILPKYIGQKVKRTEDPRLIQGIGHYVDDIELAGTLSLFILRSPYAHAKINSINIEAAKNAPGVVAVYTGKDVEGRIGAVPCAAAMPELKVPKYPVLATGKVIFVGQPVAAVVATYIYHSRDATDLTEIYYDPLDVIHDAEKAAQGNSPVIHEEFGTNVAYLHSAGSGDVEAAFKQADKIITQRLNHQRLAPI